MPERVRLRRTKGWRMPKHTKRVDRSTRWGTPFAVNTVYERETSPDLWPAIELALDELPGWAAAAAAIRDLGYICPRERETVVTLYSRWLRLHPEVVARAREELRGWNLGCWCPEDAACHADVLLEAANPRRPSR